MFSPLQYSTFKLTPKQLLNQFTPKAEDVWLKVCSLDDLNMLLDNPSGFNHIRRLSVRVIGNWYRSKGGRQSLTDLKDVLNRLDLDHFAIHYPEPSPFDGKYKCTTCASSRFFEDGSTEKFVCEEGHVLPIIEEELDGSDD